MKDERTRCTRGQNSTERPGPREDGIGSSKCLPHSLELSRRRFSFLAGATLAMPLLPHDMPLVSCPRVVQLPWRHAISLLKAVKYRSGFGQFDYVNASAPKGGIVRQTVLGTYDNLNLVVAGLKGSLAAGIDLIYETLLVPSMDEISSEYGLLAEAVAYPEDFSFAAYRLRSGARWQDGRPITPTDVIFSFDAFKRSNPRIATYYRHVLKVQMTGEHEVTFTFDRAGNRELPQIVGQLHVLPKHWWEGVDNLGNKRDVTSTTLEPPLGSGPYRVKSCEPGRTIVYERVRNYWAKGLNVKVGHDNFDELRFDYFRDETAAFEAFKAGEADWYIENSAKGWATGYDFPAVNNKRIVLEEFPIRNLGIMQAFVFNIRRDKFKEPLLRRAFNFAFDFEEINRDIFDGQYKRISSYFQGTELASSGLPEGKELSILLSVRDRIPPDVFTSAYWNPVSGNPQALRKNLRQAMYLLNGAGYDLLGDRLVKSKTGEKLGVEFLVNDPSYERFLLFYKVSLERLGIDVSIRVVDAAQYESRLRQWDFDMIVASWVESLFPGNEQRDFWGSRAADTPGSRNLIGIKNSAIDRLIDRVVFATDREELVAATRALDRVLLWNHYVVPQWSYDKVRTARWDRFAHTNLMPKYDQPAFPSIWWWDEERAAAIAAQKPRRANIMNSSFATDGAASRREQGVSGFKQRFVDR